MQNMIFRRRAKECNGAIGYPCFNGLKANNDGFAIPLIEIWNWSDSFRMQIILNQSLLFMPKLLTNTDRRVFQSVVPAMPNGGILTSVCTSTYDEYQSQRTELPDASGDIDSLTEKFKIQISDPINAMNPDIEMGQYFVIPVSEIRKMIDDSGDNPEFIHICNALRDTQNSQGETKTYPVAILVPVKKKVFNQDSFFEVCKNQQSVYIEAYPCPPAPGCPHTERLIEGLFKPGTQISNFRNLF